MIAGSKAAAATPTTTAITATQPRPAPRPEPPIRRLRGRVSDEPHFGQRRRIPSGISVRHRMHSSRVIAASP